MKILVIVLVLMLGICCRARHIHPSNVAPEEILFEEMDNVETEQPINVLNLKPTGFVPINSFLFFKAFEPCEDGFKRDVLGICREVWDK